MRPDCCGRMRQVELEWSDEQWQRGRGQSCCWKLAAAEQLAARQQGSKAATQQPARSNNSSVRAFRRAGENLQCSFRSTSSAAFINRSVLLSLPPLPDTGCAGDLLAFDSIVDCLLVLALFASATRAVDSAVDCFSACPYRPTSGAVGDSSAKRPLSSWC